ncbi:MAG: zinc ABC transporter substrate-binding protein [Phycisphaerae bacterium]|nr:zinc ABC transporter substrate-binding protein [Phycisphaerae bacterium]
MKRMSILITLATVFPTTGVCAKSHLNVVTTLPDYASIAKVIGGDRISVKSIVRGDQDAHFIRPKPSFATALRNADVLVATGLDLELWVQTVIDNSGNGKIRSGKPGYVSVSAGMKLLEKPRTLSRAEGGVHIHGNPHVTCSPIQMKVAARNIAAGLTKNDPEGKEMYLQNLEELHRQIDERLFGSKLVEMLGSDTLCSLAEQDELIRFLQKQNFEGRPLIEYLGGWMKKMLPLRGTPLVTYHKNWIYFVRLFGLEEAGTVEPKPGIPPSPKHVTSLISLMRERNVGIILAANYFDEQQIRTVAARTNAEAVIVPLYVGGAAGVGDYFELVDHWIDGLLRAAEKKSILGER